jgi:hypothetical protein
VLRAIARCRTTALGGHLDSCSQCGRQVISYNSCRNRHCPKCQTQARQRWLTAREQEVLNVSYFHVVFTLPHELNPLCQRKRCFMTCCFVPAPPRCSKSLRTRSTWEPRLGSSAFCIPGVRTYSCTLTRNAWHYHLIDFQRTTLVGLPCDPLVKRACLSDVAAR